MGANEKDLNFDERSEQKIHERSEFIVAFDFALDFAFAFSKIHNEISQKIAPRIERKRDSIEFERSENIGQFFKWKAFNYFKVFKCF